VRHIKAVVGAIAEELVLVPATGTRSLHTQHQRPAVGHVMLVFGVSIEVHCGLPALRSTRARSTGHIGVTIIDCNAATRTEAESQNVSAAGERRFADIARIKTIITGIDV